MSPAGAGTALYRRVSDGVVARFASSSARAFAVTLGLVVAIWLAAFVWYHGGPSSPGDVYRPISPASVKPGAVSGAPCPNSSVAQAWISNDVGDGLVTVVCSNGVTLEVPK